MLRGSPGWRIITPLPPIVAENPPDLDVLKDPPLPRVLPKVRLVHHPALLHHPAGCGVAGEVHGMDPVQPEDTEPVLDHRTDGFGGIPFAPAGLRNPEPEFAAGMSGLDPKT